MQLIKPKPFELEDMDGEKVEVILSRFPATVGREIGAKYPMANLPKLGDYKVSDEVMEKLMSYVAVPAINSNTGERIEGAADIILKTRALIDTHMRDAETLMRVEMAMLEYNFSFFRKGRISDFLGEFVQMIVARITAMSTQSSEPSLHQEKQP